MTGPGGNADEGTNPCPCVLCQPGCTGHVDDNRRVCQNHRDRLRADLADIPHEYALLRAELPPRGRFGPKVSGSRSAPVPGGLDRLSLRGPGARANVDFAMDPETGQLDPTKADPTTGLLPDGDQYGQVPVFAALESWERDWRETLGWPVVGEWRDLQAALSGIVRFLLAQLDWACDHHPALGDFAVEVRQVRMAMRATRGDRPETIHVGACPTQVGDVVCGAPLYASTWRDVIRCNRCGVRRERSEWEHLGRLMRGGAA